MKNRNSLVTIIFSIGVGFFSFFVSWILSFMSAVLLGWFTGNGEGIGFLAILVFGFLIATIVGIISFVIGFFFGKKFWTKHFDSKSTGNNGVLKKRDRKLVKLAVFHPFAAIAIFGTYFFTELAFRNYIFSHKDPTMCYQLGANPDDVKKCYVKKLSNADKYEYCFPEKTKLAKNEESFCLINVAINTNNSSICQEATIEYPRFSSQVDSQNYCYKMVASKNKDKSLCEKLTPTTNKPNIVDECKNQVF